jgi:DNA (cytosine-5)-methyltransferase 1
MKVLDLFCGAGGITKGFLKAGFEVVGVDSSELVKTTFEENNHATFTPGDLFREVIKEKCEIITGGPPCKPWSSVNLTRRRMDHRDHRLIGRFFAHIEYHKPEVFLFENVPPLQNDPILRRYLARMEKFGYSTADAIVRYSHYGASTARGRLIVFGTRSGKVDTFFNLLERQKRPASTVKDAIWDLRHKGRGEVPDHVWPELRTIYKYRKYYKSNKYGWYILKWNKPAPSFGNVMKTYILHPYGLDKPSTRVISVKEAMLIMGFSKDFAFPEKIGMGEKYQMTVDSVSPVFSYAAARAIKEMLSGKEPDSIPRPIPNIH